VVKNKNSLLNWVDRPAGHFGLLVIPLTIVTVLCFAWILAQTPSTKAGPVASTPGQHGGSSAVASHSELPFTNAPDLPILAENSVTVSSAPPNQTATPQPAAASPPSLQAASTTDANPATHAKAHKTGQDKHD